MTRHEALTALLAKVEAGKDWHFNECPPPVDLPDIWIDAFHGSLDAAEALHDALLPTGAWSWQLWIDHNGIPTAVIDGWEFSTPEVTAETPARAWLIAILKALIAMEGDHA